MLNDLTISHICFLLIMHSDEWGMVELGLRQWAGSVGQPVFWVFQVGRKGAESPRDRGEEVDVSCCLITAVWEVLCTWQSPAQQTLWHRHSLSARRLSSSGPPEPCAFEKETRQKQTAGEGEVREKREQYIKTGEHSYAIFSTFVKPQWDGVAKWQNKVMCPLQRKLHESGP